MKSIFKSKARITQTFANKLIIDGKDYYARFGLSGHEGLDAVPTGTQKDVLSVCDGVVVKDEDNAKSGSYGVSVTVWSSNLNLAFQYCHLSSNTVGLGEFVKEGQVIGFMGGTGNVMGDHLHLNMFETDSNGVRQNRNNGFLGGVDPLPFLEQETPEPTNIYTDLDKCRTDRDTHWRDLDAVKSDLGVPGEYSLVNVRNRINSLLESERALGKQASVNQELNLQISEVKTTNKNLAKEISDTKELLTIATQKITDLASANKEQAEQIEKLKNQHPVLEETLGDIVLRLIRKLQGKL